MIILGDAADKVAARLPVAHALAHEKVQHGAAGVFGLQRVLVVERGKRVFGMVDRKVRRVGVVGRVGNAGLDDARETNLVLFAKR